MATAEDRRVRLQGYADAKSLERTLAGQSPTPGWSARVQAVLQRALTRRGRDDSSA